MAVYYDPLDRYRRNQARTRPSGVVVMPRPGQSLRPPAPPAREEAPPATKTNDIAASIIAKGRAFQEPAQKEEDDGGNPFGRGLGFVINNPLTRGMLKPLEYLDYGRRAVTLGLEELAEGITGQELKATEGDERSNWDKLNDPEYGVGQLLGGTLGDITPWEWDDQWVDRVGGFLGDVAFDPLSYVGGIGLATKAMPAGGRAARLALASKELNAARRAGASADEIADLTNRLQKATSRGFAVDPELAKSVGARGGVRLTTNPFSPYRGAQATIPGSERVTNALSRGRTKVGEVIGSTNTGRRVQSLRTPKGLEPDYERAFYGLGDVPMETALDNVNLYQKARRVGSAFSRPLTSQADRLTYEFRKVPEEVKRAVMDQLETEGAKLSPEAEKVQKLFDAAFERATKQYKLPLRYRQRYAPHILTRDAMEWRRNPENTGKIVAPNGFFTEAKYDPSGVTMGRRFHIGDEFVVNGTPIKIEKATVREVNEKFRKAGLDFDFFESDPGIVAQKYLNMLSDDVGIHVAAKEMAEESANRAQVRLPATYGGRAVQDLEAQHIIRGGGAKEILDTDLGTVGKQLGVELDPEVYSLRLDKDATKGVNVTTVLQSKKQVKTLNQELKEARKALDTRLRQIAKGEAGWPGAPSLKAELRVREEGVKDLAERAATARGLLSEAVDEQAVLIDRVAWHSGVVDEIDDELKRINFLISQIKDSAPKEVMDDLNAQRRILSDQFEKSRDVSERARNRIRNRTAFEGGLDDMIAERRAALYEAAGVERPQSGALPGARTGPIIEEYGVTPYPKGREAAELESQIATNIVKPNGFFKEKLNRLAKITGKSEEEILDDLAEKGIDVSRGRQVGTTSFVPDRAAVKTSVAEARQEVLDESRGNLERLMRNDGPPPGPSASPKKGGEWDALNEYYSNLQSTSRGQSLLRKMRAEGLVAPHGGALTPDQFAQNVSEALRRDVSVDEAVDIYFREAKRYIDALPKRPKDISDEVAERAAVKSGTTPELVRGSQNADDYRFAAQQMEQRLGVSRAETGNAIAEIVGPDETNRLSNLLDEIQDQAVDEQKRILLEEIEDSLARAGVRPDEYVELLYEVDDPRVIARSLTEEIPEQAPVAPTAAPRQPAPQQAAPPPAAGPPPPTAQEYEEISALRAERKALVDEANSVPGLKRANQEAQQRLDDYIRRVGVTDEDVMGGHMFVEAKLAERRQRLADEAQRRVMSGDEAGARAITEELRSMPDSDGVLDEYDRIKAKIGGNEARIADIEARAPELQASIDALDQQITAKADDMLIRLPKREADPGAYDREFRRLLGDEQAEAMRRAERAPTVGKGATPNLEGSTKITGQGQVGVGRRELRVPEGKVRQEIILKKGKALAKVRAHEKQIKALKKRVSQHPKVQRATAKVTRQSINRKLIRRGKVALPERPGKAPRNLKEFPDWDSATEFWTKQVDEIIEGRPIMGGPDAASPRALAEAEQELRDAIDEVSQMVKLPEEQAKLAEAIEEHARIRSLLDSKVYVDDDPASVRILSEKIRKASDAGELETLLELERTTVARRQQAGRLNEADAALARSEALKRQGISEELIDVEDQLDELTTNPQAQEALRREAMDQPEARKVTERKTKLESESNASKAIAAASQAKLGDVERRVVELQAEMADITAGQIDGSKLAGQARGRIGRVSKLNPKNRGELKVEEFLQSILDMDPDLRQIDNQATVFAILKAEEDAEAIGTLLKKIEDAKLSAEGDHLSRVVDVVLNDTWSAMMPDISGPNGPIIHADLARRHRNVVRITKESNFWKHVDTLTGLFKTYATLTPGFHVRNALSAAFMNASDGVPVKTMVRSASIMREYGQAVKQGDEAVKAWLIKQADTVINEDTGATVMDALDAAAGTGIGGRYREHGVGDRSLARNRMTERAFENVLTHWVGKKPGTFIESSVRLPATMDALIKGNTVEEAVLRATRLHFDYSEVSQFDETMRRLIPFWTFMSRNLPLQVSQMYTNPRAYAKYNSFVRNFKGQPEENEPDYFSKIGAFRFADVEIGGLPIYLQPDLQHTRLEEDVDKIYDVLSLENPARALSDFNPLFTAPAEYISGQNFYTGRRYGDDDYRRTGPIEAPVAALARFLGRTKETPGGNRATEEKFLEALRSLIPLYDRSVRLTPQLTTGGNDEDAVARQIESVARLFGVPGRQLSPQQQQSEAMRRYYSGRDEMRERRALAELDN